MRASLIIFLACFLANPSFAQSLSERATSVSGRDFVVPFLGHCAQNPGRIDRVQAAAKALGLMDIPDEMKPLVAPQDPSAIFSGYVALEGAGSPYFLAVSVSKDGQQTFETCVLANPYIDTKSVVKALEDMAGLKQPDDDQTIAGQRYRVWQTDNIAIGSFISLTDAEPMGFGGATLGISAPSAK